ncbi:MAG: CDP-alcohol phosphatidyltransferase family protein [Gammaproteobacteria bacterium]
MEAGNRRPIRARSLGWVNRAATLLAASGVTPNQISAFSVVVSLLVPLGLMLFGNDRWAGVLLAAAGIQLRLLCNLLDGMVAIEGAKKGALGDIYNEFPDRLSDTIILLGIAYSVHGLPAVHALGWAASFFAAMTAYTRVLGASVGTRHYYAGPMAKQHRMALLTVVLLSVPFADRLGLAPDRTIAITLAVICLGAAATCGNRLRLIAAELRARPR